MHANPSEKPAGFPGQRLVRLPEPLAQMAPRRTPLLRGLFVTGAGYFPRAADHARRRPEGIEETVLIYCVKGTGWCHMAGRTLPVREGDLLILPPLIPHAYGAQNPHPWTIHWIHALGKHLPEYFRELSLSTDKPILHVGEDLQLVLLFNEILQCLEHGMAFRHLLQASHALAHLFSLLIQVRHQHGGDTADGLQKVARGIEYMSDHLDQALKVNALASLVNLSPAHFTALFKEQTGSPPRDYLHLLRMHRACQWLADPALPIKEIAARLGYQDQFHFSRKFKAFIGVSPTQYRATLRVG